MIKLNANPRLNYYFTWILLLSLAIFQYHLFKSFLYHEVIGFYPANNDQAVFLPLTYETFEKFIHGNIGAAFTYLFNNFPNGFLFPVNALITFIFTEPNRFNALLPNLLYFLTLQICAFWTVKKITGRNYLGFIIVGLLLVINTPFLGWGGVADFRMDFIAFCMYGILTCITLQSSVFLNRKWSLIACSIAIAMMLTRCITTVYFALTVMTLITYYGCQRHFSKNDTARSDAKNRLINITICCIFAFAIIIPYFYINRNFFYNYYIVGHITGTEKIFREVPGGDVIKTLLFYPNSIFSDHIGKIGQRIISILLASYALLFLLSFRKKVNFVWKNEFLFLILAIFFPLLALSLDQSKSPIVGGILVAPILLFVVGLIFYIDQKAFPKTPSYFLQWGLNGIAIAILVAGLAHQQHSYLRKDANQIKNLSSLSEMYNDISNYANKNNWANVIMSHDQVSESINYGCLKTLYFEKNKKIIKAEASLMGSTLYSVSEKEALDSLNKSNVIILTINKYSNPDPFPFNKSMAALQPTLIKYADSHFHKLGDYSYYDKQYRVYVAV